MVMSDLTPAGAALLAERDEAIRVLRAGVNVVGRIEPAAVRDPVRYILLAAAELCAMDEHILGKPVAHALALAGALVNSQPAPSSAKAGSNAALTEDMVERAAEEMRSQYDSEYDASHLSWQDFAGDARKVLAAALGSRVVLDLPEPDGQDEQGDPAWTVRGVVADEPEHIVAYAHNGSPRVSSIGPPEDPDLVEVYAVGLIAAARAARRLAAEGGGQT